MLEGVVENLESLFVNLVWKELFADRLLFR